MHTLTPGHMLSNNDLCAVHVTIFSNNGLCAVDITIFSNNGLCAVDITIISTDGKFQMVLDFAELHALTQAAYILFALAPLGERHFIRRLPRA